jgi:hypothetical protein
MKRFQVCRKPIEVFLQISGSDGKPRSRDEYGTGGERRFQKAKQVHMKASLSLFSHLSLLTAQSTEFIWVTQVLRPDAVE